MSFNTAHRTKIKENDLVLVWLSRGNIKPLRPRAGETLQTRYGAFHHSSIIGQEFGTQIPSSANTGYVHLLAPTPELWSLSLPHRTQIVYTPDASYIAHRLKVRPGSTVIESGTGSASFTHALARTVGSKGQVYTFEFHGPRYEQAKLELEQHGLSNVHITHRDVCNDGFGIGEQTQKLATEVFLDLPSPWTAIPHLESVVDRTKVVSICCFSPCIEQVTKSVEALKKVGFQRIEMVEVAARKWEGRKEMVREVDDAAMRLRDIRNRRNEGLKRRLDRMTSEERGQKRDAEESGLSASDADPSPSDVKPGPRAKPGFNPFGKGQHIKEGDESFSWNNVSRVEPELKTHTSYLTFAVLPPRLS